MSNSAEVRIDKWLWSVRLFKTRSQASEACKKRQVMMDNAPVKSSRSIKAGDVIQIKNPPVVNSYKVLQVVEKRMGAKLVPDFMKDVTPPEQLEILELQKINLQLNRAKGTGRPTKKDRRDLDDFFTSE